MSSFNRQFTSGRLVSRDASSRASLAVFTVRFGSTISYSERERRHAFRVMALMKPIYFTNPCSASDILGRVDFVSTAISRNDLLTFLVTATSPTDQYTQGILKDLYIFQLIKVEFLSSVVSLGILTMLFQLKRLYGVK